MLLLIIIANLLFALIAAIFAISAMAILRAIKQPL